MLYARNAAPRVVVCNWLFISVDNANAVVKNDAQTIAQPRDTGHDLLLWDEG